MESSPEHDPKQASYKEKAAIKWNVNDLLAWIKEKRPNLLCDVKSEKLRKAEVTGELFLGYAGEVEFFRNVFMLSPGTSFILAKLAKELAEGETAVIKSKLLSFMSCTSRRQQANNVTGNRQQAEDVDMSGAADSAGKSTDHASEFAEAGGEARRLQANNVTGNRQQAEDVEHTIKRKAPPHTDIAPSPKRTQVGECSLIINGELKHFRSGSKAFPTLLRKEGQAYFDRTCYISRLHKIDDFILFCRPSRFGKTLTVSMLEHFHGLQYAGDHQSLYKVCNNILNYLDVRTYFSFNHSRISMCKKISTKEK